MVAPINGISKETLKYNKEKWDSCLSKYKKVFKMKKKVSKPEDTNKEFRQRYVSHDWTNCLCKVYNQMRENKKDSPLPSECVKGDVIGILVRIDMSSDYPFTIKTKNGVKSFRFCEPIDNINSFNKKYCNFDCKDPEKYLYKGKNKVCMWNFGIPYAHGYLPDTPIRRWLWENRVKLTGVGFDYCDVFGIKEGCVYSVYCGDTHGCLFCLDHFQELYEDPSKEEELELAKELWEKYKDGYEQFINKHEFKETENN